MLEGTDLPLCTCEGERTNLKNLSLMSSREQTEAIHSGWQSLLFTEPSIGPFIHLLNLFSVVRLAREWGIFLRPFVFLAPIIIVSYVKCTLYKCLSEYMEGVKYT